MRKIIVLDDSDPDPHLAFMHDVDVVVRKVTHYEVIKNRFGPPGVRIKSLDELGVK